MQQNPSCPHLRRYVRCEGVWRQLACAQCDIRIGHPWKAKITEPGTRKPILALNCLPARFRRARPHAHKPAHV